MRLAKNLLLAGGTALVLLGIAALLQDPESGDILGLRLFPAMALQLPRPFIGGGDFPASLSALGVVAVYLVPGALCLAGGLALHRRVRS